MFSKEQLEGMYASMSVDDMAKSLGVAKSTLYYHMRKHKIALRSKSDAQKKHLAAGQHQRTGQRHSSKSKELISESTRKFWESDVGQEQKSKLGDLRRQEWEKSSTGERRSILNRLQSASRPGPGALSRFGVKLADFLSKRETVATGLKLTADHVSDIILEDRKVVLELILPTDVYGDQQQQKISARYDRIVSDLNQAGYRVVVIEDKSNSLSEARCKRIYEELVQFFTNNKQSLHLVS